MEELVIFLVYGLLPVGFYVAFMYLINGMRFAFRMNLGDVPRSKWDELSIKPKYGEGNISGPQLSISFSTGHGNYQFISVTNHGDSRKFWADATVITSRDPAGGHDTLPYRVPWESPDDKKPVTLIRKEHWAKLLIVTFHTDIPPHVIMKLRSISGIFHENSWVVDSSCRTRPAYRLLVKIWGEDLQAPFEEKVWVFPENEQGPLKISKDAPEAEFTSQSESPNNVATTLENVPEILLIYDANLRTPNYEELRLVTLRNTASKGSTESKDAFDISIDIEGYLDYQAKVDPIPRLLKGDEIQLKISLQDRPVSTIVDALSRKAEDVGKAHGKANPELFLAASVSYRNSRNEWFQAQHAIYFDLWGQKMWTKYIKVVRLSSSPELTS